MTSVGIDLASVAELLRTRRRALQPEDVGLATGRRRRTPGLRREEVAAMCSMSTAYYSRLERHRGPRPSPPMLASIARALRFSRAERDHLFSAAGYDLTEHLLGTTHLDPGLMLILGRLSDTAALALDPIGEVLHQSSPAKALFGDLTGHTGWARSSYYRWFTEPSERDRYPQRDHPVIAAEIAIDLRQSQSLKHHDGTAARLVQLLLHRSEEFALHWYRQTSRITVRAARQSQIIHPELGVIDLHREMLSTTDRSQRIVVYLTTPGTESHTKLQLASVIGHHRFRP